MQSRKNKVVVASAGSRKTSMLVEYALALTGKRVLLTTYTNENVDQIRSYIVQKHGHIPPRITVLSWFTFLLQHGVRPYQNCASGSKRIKGIYFDSVPPLLKFVRKTNPDRYFLTNDCEVYRDRIADFVCLCDTRSQGAVVNRISRIWDHLLIDELQDLAGYDLDLIERLFASSISVLAVGDPRQATYSTNNSAKNKQFKGDHISEWVHKMEERGLVGVGELTACYRSNQAICDFADALFPHLPPTTSMNTQTTGHDGVCIIGSDAVQAYVSQFGPVVLRYNKTSSTMGLPAWNIGAMKGRTFDRVLIFPTKNMKEYLKTGDLEKSGDIARLYVAVTRARYSVAFVADEFATGGKLRLLGKLTR